MNLSCGRSVGCRVPLDLQVTHGLTKSGLFKYGAARAVDREYIYIYIYIYILVDMADTPKNIDFEHYMALGMVWYGAKYSHGVWEQFAHTFEK